MASYKVEQLPSPLNVLGEGPHWCIERQCLYYNDIYGGTIHRYDYAENKTYTAKVDGFPVIAFIIPVMNKNTEFIIGTDKKITLIEWDGTASEAKFVKTVGEVEFDLPDNRFNDAKVDSKGRFYGGTMRLEAKGDIFEARLGTFYRFDCKQRKFVALKKNIGVSNGLCWNEAGNLLYYIDSCDLDVKEYHVDKNGDISDERKVTDFTVNGTRPPFVPDGMTIDNDGFLYVATFGGSTVYKINPTNGKTELEIKMPCEQVTSVAFGGPNLDVLFVTTAAKEFKSPQHPPAGALFKVTGLGARGAPIVLFSVLLEPDYADGHIKPRTSVGSHALPAPDAIIDQLQRSISIGAVHPHVTVMLPAWGQLLAYDLVQILSPHSSFRCCRNDSSTDTTDEIIQCYVRTGDGCKEYKRSIPSKEPGTCKFDYRNQMNAASGFLDGSGLYGTTDKEILALRTFTNGKVDIKACLRCNEPGAIGALHTILLKEHNRIADEMSRLNKEWSDTTLFYETRRAIIAQIQHITYNEFLPIVLGSQIASSPDLRIEHGKHYSGYSSSNRAGVFNEIAVGAIPAFLTMLPPDMYNESASAEILISTPSMLQTFIPDHATFNDEWTPIALALQRGRDHGVPSYHKALNLCEKRFGIPYGSKLTFDDMEYFGLSPVKRKTLESIYQDAEDIDLLVGGLSETATLGTVFGPTLTCLLAIQFANLRNSDRFWYENDLPPSSLSLPQLQAIRRVTLSGLLCKAKGVSKAQPKAFIREDPYLNARLNCEQIAGMDVTPWRTEIVEEVEEDLEEQTQPPPELADLDIDVIEQAIVKAKDKLNERKRFEYESWVNLGGIDAKSPAGTAASFSKANKNALIIANTSLLYELASNEILSTLHSLRRRKRQVFDNNLGAAFGGDNFSNALQTIDVNQFITGSISPINLEPQCENLEAPCDTATPFQTLTGHCNNLRSPDLGKSLTTFARLLPAVYDDGISQPRTIAISGNPLPNPRTVSSLIHPDISNLHTRYSLMVMQYAQFLDHDLTMTPIHKGFHESIPSCRSCDSSRTVHPECNPFPVPPRDHYYPELNVTSGERLCFPFMRSLPGQQTLGPREQINQNTAFLDASQIYGENGCVGKGLRGFSGRLNSTIHPIRGKELLPQTPIHPECKSASGYCFAAGDARASEQPGLTTIHTVFMREHNRIVEGLRGVNPHWNGDQLYEHARRILIAQNQHITYNEFLPRILSWNAVNLYGLKLLPQGYYKDYNPTCNPAIVTEFASAAFRIGHSLLRPHIPRLSAQHQPIDPPILLRDGFFKMDIFLQQVGLIDEIARGLVATPMETLDQFITGEVTNHLFEDRRIPFSGIDLIALNVQRARDHGIPSYNSYRALCNLKRAQTWEDLTREIPPEVISRLKRLYNSVDDIDLFPGGMSERPLQGGLVGPTFACIIAIQFRQVRKCDRFWYENEDPTVKFTEAQLAELRKTMLSKIVCENLDIQSDMQRAAFDLPSNFLNDSVRGCDRCPSLTSCYSDRILSDLDSDRILSDKCE